MLKAREIRNRLVSIQATRQITQALKMIAVAKLGKVKKIIIPLLRYTSEFIQIFERVAFAPSQRVLASDFLQPKPVQNLLIAFFTTNRGFCGGLNKQVCQQVNLLYQQHIAQRKKVNLLPIGKKGVLFLKKRQLPYINTHLDLGKKLCLLQTQSLGKFLLDKFGKSTYERIVFIYPYNTNYLDQRIDTQQILPIQPITPPTQHQEIDYIYEPSREAIIHNMLPNLITLNLYQALLRAAEAEHAARNNAMSKATDNADTLLKELRMAYNRTRQTAITRQIIEIAASAEVFRHA